MASLEGALELIGVRAVILDFRQYMTQGNQLSAATANMAKATESVEKAAQKASLAQNNLNAINAQAFSSNARLTASIQSVAAAQAKLNTARLQAASPQVANLGFVGQAAAANNVAGAEQALKVAQAEQKLAAASIPTLSAQVAARGAVTRAIEVQAAAEAKLGAASEKESALSSARIRTLAGGASLLGAAAAVGIGAQAVKSAADYQTQLVKINNLTSLSTAETDKLGKSLLDLSKEVPTSPAELGATAYFVLSSGIKDVNEALAITKLSAEDSAIGLGKSEEVARVLTATINAYGKQNITAAQASDILVAAVKEGSGEAADFAGSLGRVLGTASNLGVKFTDLTATIASLTNVGLNADEATTAVLGILNQLSKATPDAVAALKSVGLTVEGVRESIQTKGFVATMYDLAKAFQGNTAALHPLLPEVRGLNGFVTAFTVQGQATAKILDNIGNAAGVTASGFAKARETVAANAQILKNEFGVALIQIGSALLPQVNQTLKDLIGWIEKNKEAIQSFVTQGLQTAIQTVKDFAAGIDLIINVLGYIPANQATITAAIIAIGAAFAWALPGSPYIKGLLLVLTLLGQIQKGIDLPLVGGVGGDTKHTIATAIGATVVGGLGFAGAGPLGGIAGTAAGGVAGSKLADLLFGEVKKKAEDTKKSVDPLDAALDKFGKITLPNLERNTGGVEKADKKLIEQMAKLASEFKSTSDAAATAESFTKKLKLFGEIGPDLAHAFDLNATQAGAVQAADAIIRAIDNVDNAEFERVKTLATVANLIAQGSEDLARQTVLGLARGALEASQKALGTVLGGPTREVADLGIPLAQSRLRGAQVSERIDPQLSQLSNLTTSIDRQLKVIDRRQSEEDKKRKVRDDALKTVFDRQNDILTDQLDALKYQNQLAKNTYELQAEKLQDLIDANKKAVSDLQANFLKSNEALQTRINQAIGQGNSGLALSLVQQQQNETRGFRTANNVLNANGQGLTLQQTTAERAEKHREREEQLLEQEVEKRQKLIKRQQDEIEEYFKHTDAIKDSRFNTQNLNNILNDEKEKIQEKVDALNREKDVTDQATKKIQDHIAVLQAQTDIVKAQGEAANKTLLSQQEQGRVASDLIKQIGFESQAVRDLTTVQGDLYKDVGEANIQFGLLKDAVKALTEDGFRNTLIAEGIDPAAKRASIMAAAMKEAGENTTGAAGDFGNSLSNSSKDVEDWVTKLLRNTNQLAQNFGGASQPSSSGGGRSTLGSILHAVTDPIGNFLSGASLPHGTLGFGFAEGGFTGNHGGFVHPNEVVLPLGSPSRSREILGQLPAGFTASLNRGRIGPSSIFGNVNINGSTREELKALAHQAIDEAFSRSSRTAGNGGSLLSIGVGAGGF